MVQGKSMAAADGGLVRFGELALLERANDKAGGVLPRQDEARTLMLRAAKQVEPIMKKRGWNVRKLIEIIPPSPNLMGWNQNKGETVAIRLRRVHDTSSFFDFNHVLGTMLHELAHIEVGPHNQKFYSLLDELWSEAEELMDKGIKGLGAFECEGHRSGGLLKSKAGMREAQVQAALKRQKMGVLMGGASSGKKLGGCRIGKDVRQLAAEAAQRRAVDDVWCQAPHMDAALVGTHGLNQDNPSGRHGSAAGAGSGRRASAYSREEEDADLQAALAASMRECEGITGDAKPSCRLTTETASSEKTGGKEGHSRCSERPLLDTRSTATNNAKSPRSPKRVGGDKTREKGGNTVIDLTVDDGPEEVCVVLSPSPCKPPRPGLMSGQDDTRGGSGVQAACPRCKQVNVLASLTVMQQAPLCQSCGALL